MTNIDEMTTTLFTTVMEPIMVVSCDGCKSEQSHDRPDFMIFFLAVIRQMPRSLSNSMVCYGHGFAEIITIFLKKHKQT